MSETPHKDPLAAQGATPGDTSENDLAGVPPAPSDPEPKKPAEGDPKPEDKTDPKPDDKTVPKPEDAPKEETKSEDGEDWIATGDSTLDDAISVLKASGLKKAEAEALFEKVIESGDINQIDRAALEKALGKSQANLVLIGVTDYLGRQAEKKAKVEEIAHETLGGPEAWKTATEWANGKAKDDSTFAGTLNEIADMLDHGGWRAKAAAEHLKSLYEGAQENGSLDKSLQSATGAANGKAGEGYALGRAEYVKLMKEAQDSGNATAVAELRKRRQAGRERGL